MGHTCRDEGKGFALKEMDISGNHRPIASACAKKGIKRVDERLK